MSSLRPAHASRWVPHICDPPCVYLCAIICDGVAGVTDAVVSLDEDGEEGQGAGGGWSSTGQWVCFKLWHHCCGQADSTHLMQEGMGRLLGFPLELEVTLDWKNRRELSRCTAVAALGCVGFLME